MGRRKKVGESGNGTLAICLLIAYLANMITYQIFSSIKSKAGPRSTLQLHYLTMNSTILQCNTILTWCKCKLFSTFVAWLYRPLWMWSSVEVETLKSYQESLFICAWFLFVMVNRRKTRRGKNSLQKNSIVPGSFPACLSLGFCVQSKETHCLSSAYGGLMSACFPKCCLKP